MTKLEQLAENAENIEGQGCRFCSTYSRAYIDGFKAAREIAFYEAIQWTNNPSLETMKGLLSIGEQPYEVPEVIE